MLGPEHRDVAEVLTNYAWLLSALDRKAESAELHARAKMILTQWKEQEEVHTNLRSYLVTVPDMNAN